MARERTAGALFDRSGETPYLHQHGTSVCLFIYALFFGGTKRTQR
jgi:hypothetical protein